MRKRERGKQRANQMQQNGWPKRGDDVWDGELATICQELKDIQKIGENDTLYRLKLRIET